MLNFQARRDIFILLGICALGLVPLSVITRLKKIQSEVKPTPVPASRSIGPTSVTPYGPLAFSPDGKVLAGVLPFNGAVSGQTQTATLILWRTADGKELRRWKINAYCVSELRWSPDSRTVQNSGMWVERWQTATGRRLSRVLKLRPPGPVPKPTKGAVRAAAKAYPDMAFLGGVATFGADIEVRRRGGESTEAFTASSGQSLGQWRGSLSMDPLNRSTHISPVRPIRYSYTAMNLNLKPGQKSVHPQIRLEVWDVTEKRQLWNMPLPAPMASGNFSADGKYFVVWDIFDVKNPKRRLTAMVLDAATGRKLRDFETNDITTSAVAFGASGDRFASFGVDHAIAAGTMGDRPRLRVHSVASGRLLQALLLPPEHGSVMSMALSPDGQTLATSDTHGVHLWKLADLAARGVTAHPSLLAVAPPSKRFAATSSPASSGRSPAPASPRPALPVRP